MKILITGAAGMLGTDLVSALQDRFELVGAGLSDGRHLAIPYHQLDLSDACAVNAFWKTEQPALVFHLAAMTQVDLCETERENAYQANTAAVKCVADASRDCGAALVFISTDFVFDGKAINVVSSEEIPEREYKGLTELKEKKKHIKEFILITKEKVVSEEFIHISIEDFLKE